MSGICPELDARLSAELDRYYFSTDGSGLNLDRREKHRVINALHRLWNIEEIACYGVGFAKKLRCCHTKKSCGCLYRRRKKSFMSLSSSDLPQVCGVANCSG